MDIDSLYASTVQTAQQASDMLDFVRTKLDCCLVIDGESLQVCDPVHQLRYPVIILTRPFSYVWTSTKRRSSI